MVGAGVARFVLIVILVLVVVSFFVLGSAVAGKVFQIAEDLRYLRSKTDEDIERPKDCGKEFTMYGIWAVCLSVLVIVLLWFSGLML